MDDTDSSILCHETESVCSLYSLFSGIVWRTQQLTMSEEHYSFVKLCGIRVWDSGETGGEAKDTTAVAH